MSLSLIFLNHTVCVCVCVSMKDLPPHLSVYKRIDTIKQRDQTNRFFCVCEPRERHKRHRQWQRGEMKRGKACFSGSGLQWQELHRRAVGKLFFFNKEAGEERCLHILYSACFTQHIFDTIVLKLKWMTNNAITLLPATNQDSASSSSCS